MALFIIFFILCKTADMEKAIYQDCDAWQFDKAQEAHQRILENFFLRWKQSRQFALISCQHSSKQQQTGSELNDLDPICFGKGEMCIPGSNGP